MVPKTSSKDGVFSQLTNSTFSEENPMSDVNNGKRPERPKVFTNFMMPTALPDGNGGFTPCPELLTEEEAIRFLRLDVNGPGNPSGTLKYYRDQGILRAIRIGRNLRYPRKELDRMIERLLSKPKD